jgi:glycosyltransferase involved in cell wall biosynthesis
MNRASPPPIRVLHVVGGMVRGGIETWLMHILRQGDRERFRMDFVVHTTEPCPYDEELRSFGSRIFPCPHPGKPWRYVRDFRRILDEHGPYDIVHSHVHFFSGFTLRVARQAGVPVRIGHSHVDTLPEDTAPGLPRRLYLGAMREMLRKNATLALAATPEAGNALFGPRWKEGDFYRVLFYGINLAPFHKPPEPGVRAELGLPADAFVIGHVGRMEEQKNHRFLLEIAAKVAEMEPRTRLLLIGAGSLRGEIERRAAELKITDRVIFAGLRSDIPNVLKSAVDVFVLPSFCEGLGLVLIEAQAAGVPSVFTATIPADATVVPSLVTRFDLSRPASEWAEAILALRDRLHPIPPAEALAKVEASPFDIQRSVRALQESYLRALGR